MDVAAPAQACAARTRAADGWLRALLGPSSGLALVAVGGYGRGQLCPGSDLDVLMLHAEDTEPAATAERIWHAVWSAGVALDHSVRTVRQAITLAAGDLKVALGLLDARHVAGDPRLTWALAAGVRRQWRQRARRYLPELVSLTRARHARYGELRCLLEPDLVRAQGGLRDLQALQAVALAAPELGPLDDAVTSAGAQLLAVRVALRSGPDRASGRPSDVLALQEQDRVARALGLEDGAELGRRVADAAATIGWAGEDTWVRLERRARHSRARPRRWDRRVDSDLWLRDDEICLDPAADPAADASLPVRAALASVHAHRPVARRAWLRMAADCPPAPPRWPDSLRRAFVGLLAAGAPAVPVLEGMDRHGLLARLVPEWAGVRNLGQRDPFHRWTVDRHLLETAAAAAALTAAVSRPDLLLIAALLHDIGKGRAADHSVAGAVLARGITLRMGFTAAEAAVVGDLVRHHLLLVTTATLRDLDDPRTVAAVAAAVGDPDRLALLAALTEADGHATGPTAWGPWKAALVADLVGRATGLLRGVPAAARGPELPRPGDAAAVAAGRLHVRVAGAEVTVVAPAGPRLFPLAAGVLALHRHDVVAAQAAQTGAMAVAAFTVESRGGPPDAARLTADLQRALGGGWAVGAALTQRAAAYPRSRLVATPPTVRFDDAASDRATVLEVRTADRIGVLYRMAAAIVAADLHITAARVQTYGLEAVDAFYVVDAAGQPLREPAARAALRRRLAAALAQL